MKAEKILAENPNVAELLHKWFFDKLTQSFKDFDKDEAFKDYMMAKGVSEKQVISIMTDSPRACFDLLDSHEIIITIHYDKNYKTGQLFLDVFGALARPFGKDDLLILTEIRDRIDGNGLDHFASPCPIERRHHDSAKDQQQDPDGDQ